MKAILSILCAMALAAALGYGAMRGSGRAVHEREMVAAFVPALAGGLAAVLPAALRRGAGQAAVVQGAFLGMVLHLGAIAILALAAWILLNLRGPATVPFAGWLMWFYWVSLAAAATALVRLVRTTPMDATDGAR